MDDGSLFQDFQFRDRFFETLDNLFHPLLKKQLHIGMLLHNVLTKLFQSDNLVEMFSVTCILQREFSG